jgi:hypothetical protein
MAVKKISHYYCHVHVIAVKFIFCVALTCLDWELVEALVRTV